MTTRPYELLARFKSDGSVQGVSVRTIATVNGRDYESDPLPLSATTDPAFTQFAAQFAAAAASERDALALQVVTLTADYAALNKEALDVMIERNSYKSQNDDLAAQVLDLQSKLEAALNPPVDPRHLPPFTFLALFKDEEVYAALTSTDPIIVVALAKLQTIITFVDLDLADTVNMVHYMEAVGILAAGRAAQILAGAPHQ